MSTLIVDELENLAGTRSTSSNNIIAGCAKALVNFNGTGTVAIRSSYNVTSVTDNGTGNYTVNFTTAFADTTYLAAHNGGTVGQTASSRTGTSNTVSAYTFTTNDSAGNVADSSQCHATFFIPN